MTTAMTATSSSAITKKKVLHIRVILDKRPVVSAVCYLAFETAGLGFNFRAGQIGENSDNNGRLTLQTVFVSK